MEMEMEDNYNRTPFNEWRNLVVDHDNDQFEYKPIVEGTNPQESNKGIENQALSSSIGSFDASNDQKVNSSSSSSSSLCTSLGGVLWKKVALSLAERRAARCSINGFKTPPPVRTHVTSSPFLTIPSGISPTALLDSPIMLPNSQGQSSPTTGSFEFPNFLHDNQMMLSSFPAEEDRKAVLNFSSQGDTRDQNTAASMVVDSTALEVYRGPLDNKLTPQKREHTDANEERRNQYFPEMEKKGIIHHHPATVAKTDDGYNWRKYGQKHVKGSEFPRSYFKCTHPNCTMKKKVERSHDGEITEIVYRGVHNHPMSQINASGRSMFGSSNPYSEMSDRRVENGMVCRNNIQSGGGRYNYSDWRGEGTSGSSVLTENSDPLSKSRGGHFRSPGSHDGEDEDRTTQGSVSFGEDGDGDESEAKRRKKESCPIETIGPSRSTREPKVVVQIESEIDVLDDGYRWRKYGQKVVKGNPNPRSYYKCTSAGCPVRKHVERASDNLKSVITTYEGKHNHEVPAKNNNSSNSNKMDNFPPAASNNHSNMTLAQTNSKPAGMQVQDYQLPLRGNDFMRTNFVGNIANDMNIGASSIYQMGFPSLPNHMSYNPYMLNASSGDSSMALPMNLQGSPNMALGNYRFNNYAGVQSSMGGQHLREFDSRLNKPKEEQQRDVENLYDSCLSINDQDATFFQVLGNY